MKTGIIKMLTKHFGFICDEKQDYYFNFNNIDGFYVPEIGTKVYFDDFYNKDNRLQAIKIKSYLTPSEFRDDHSVKLIMSVNKELAMLQQNDPKVKDGVGYGTAHWGLGIILSELWENNTNHSISDVDIVRGAAYLLHIHIKQAKIRGINEIMISRFLIKDNSEYSNIKDKSKSIASNVIAWSFDPSSLCIHLTALSGRAFKEVKMLSEHLKLESRCFSSIHLIITEEYFKDYFDYLSAHVSLRGQMINKLQMDLLAQKYGGKFYEKNYSNEIHSKDLIKHPEEKSEEIVCVEESANVNVNHSYLKKFFCKFLKFLC